MASAKQRLLDILKQTSYLESDTPSFHLASGMHSHYYVDCKQALSFPEFRTLVADLIVGRISSEEIDAVGGLELGAYPIATSVSDKIFRETGKSIRAFVARKEAKKHGVRKLVAGCVKRGDRVLIVDDVITSGSSTIQAIDVAREEGLHIKKVIVLVDREESNGRKHIEEKGVKFEALCTLSELVKHHVRSDADEQQDSGAHSRRAIRGHSQSSSAVG